MNFQANYPIYLQIAEDIKRRIVIGELKAGDKLPSNAELALAYQVNPNTVQRIYRQLEAEGISYTCLPIMRSRHLRQDSVKLLPIRNSGTIKAVLYNVYHIE